MVGALLLLLLLARVIRRRLLRVRRCRSAGAMGLLMAVLTRLEIATVVRLLLLLARWCKVARGVALGVWTRAAVLRRMRARRVAVLAGRLVLTVGAGVFLGLQPGGEGGIVAHVGCRGLVVRRRRPPRSRRGWEFPLRRAIAGVDVVPAISMLVSEMGRLC